MEHEKKETAYYKMNLADIYIKKSGHRFYYFCLYKFENGKMPYKKWMALNFRPNLENYCAIKKEPKQIDIPIKHCR